MLWSLGRLEGFMPLSFADARCCLVVLWQDKTDTDPNRFLPILVSEGIKAYGGSNTTGVCSHVCNAKGYSWSGTRCRTHAPGPDTGSATASKHLKSLENRDSFRVGRAVQQKRRVLITNLVSFECVAASSSACGQCPLCLVNAAKCSYFYLQ